MPVAEVEVRRLDPGRLEMIFNAFPAMKRFWLGRAGTLSGGQKQMLSIARAIVEPRRLLIIDEPTKGLAPAIIAAIPASVMRKPAGLRSGSDNVVSDTQHPVVRINSNQFLLSFRRWFN